jgi:hypothetical protein
VGPGKTGTHSLANVFRRDFRAAHEPDAPRVLDVLLRYRAAQIDEADVMTFVRERDRRLRLEMDSAGYNAFLARFFAAEFAAARFVLTVRDCFSWANSAMNQLLNNPEPGAHWRAWREANFGRLEDCRHEPEEAVLAEHGMWSLDRILSVWASHYRAVLDNVPAERVFVLPIEHIGRRHEDLAAFLGVDPDALTSHQAMAFRTPHDHGLLARLPEDFVDHRVRETCGDLMNRFYPDTECRRRAFLRHVAQRG